MNNRNEILDIDPESASIQTHLSIMQNVIQRMASNSSACKTWCVTLVSAILVAVANKDAANYAYIAFVPILIFLALDTYYLALEKSFRSSYNDFIYKLHNKNLVWDDLYSVSTKGSINKHQLDSLKSFAIWGFYVPLSGLVFLAKCIAFS